MSDIRNWLKTPDEAAAEIRDRYGIPISASTVARWLREGRIPGHHLYGRWLVYLPGAFDVLDKRTNWRPSPPKQKAA
ncbi:MAG TPA: hypothetical protein VL117_10565 [Thermoleophilia bacterium]|nr:hypothetical protein [Thermoleophilia bacterium]